MASYALVAEIGNIRVERVHDNWLPDNLPLGQLAVISIAVDTSSPTQIIDILSISPY